MTREEIDNTKYKVCCPVCENKICVKGTVSCEAEQWAKSQQGDAISRQAAISIIQNWLGSDKGYSWGEKNVMLCTIDELRNLPSVSTEKTGHWIIVDDCEKFIAKCSECGRIEDSRMIDKYPYCHCGAKMEVEK